MLRQLKRYSAKKPLASFLKGNRPIEPNDNKKVGIILDLDIVEQDFDLAELQKELNVPNENFSFIVFTSRKDFPEKYNLNAFHGKRLGWNATFEENSNERAFANTNYDLLLNYFVKPSDELLILSASSKAKLKVGFPLEERRLNDLEIHVDPKDYKLFIAELKKYLAVIV